MKKLNLIDFTENKLEKKSQIFVTGGLPPDGIPPGGLGEIEYDENGDPIGWSGPKGGSGGSATTSGAATTKPPIKP